MRRTALLSCPAAVGVIRAACRAALCLSAMLVGCSMSHPRPEPAAAPEDAVEPGSQIAGEPQTPHPTGPDRPPPGGDTTGPSGLPTLSVVDARAVEADGSVVFAVALSAASDGPVSVTYHTEDGTATAGQDYVAATGTLTFAARSTVREVTIELLAGADHEGIETFTLRLSNPRGATLPDTKATGAIGAGTELVLLGVTGGESEMYPAFSSGVLHYARTCGQLADLEVTAEAYHAEATMTLRYADADANVVTAGTVTAGVTVSPDTDIAVEVSFGDQTATYVVHCLPEEFLDIKVIEKRSGVTDGLLLVTPQWEIGQSGIHMAMIDNHGVPRYRRRFERARNFRRHPDGRYSVQSGGAVHLYDSRLETRTQVHPLPPLSVSNSHDFLITGDGNFIFMAYVPSMRNSCEFEGCDPATGTMISVRDSLIQEVTPDGQKVFEWNSGDHLNLRDCTLSSNNKDYAHLNSLYLEGDDLIASFRNCHTVARIVRETAAAMEWQVGGSAARANTTTDYLTIVGDDSANNEFCRQHSAILPEPNRLVLFDNGFMCNGPRKDIEPFSRVVEYQLVNTETTKEAVFQREYRLPSNQGTAASSGSVTELSNGNWLIAWGRLQGGTAKYHERWAITEYDPANGVALLHLNMHSAANEWHAYTYRVYRESESNIDLTLNLPARSLAQEPKFHRVGSRHVPPAARGHAAAMEQLVAGSP